MRVRWVSGRGTATHSSTKVALGPLLLCGSRQGIPCTGKFVSTGVRVQPAGESHGDQALMYCTLGAMHEAFAKLENNG